jgi:hypothetical protein
MTMTTTEMRELDTDEMADVDGGYDDGTGFVCGTPWRPGVTMPPHPNA